jgi:hypothetical protein
MRRLTLALAAVLVVGAAFTGAGLAATGSAGPAPVVPETPTHTDVPCGIPTLVTVPDDTPEVTYEGFTTTYGYYKVVATLTDQSRTFALDGTGYRSTDIAPYRAEHLTLIVEPCRDSDPAEPIPSEEPTTEPEGEPAPAEQPPSGCYP